ncbi:glycoside hydrolase family 3 C-terminal domain-containing protein [Rhodanobacter sp. 7MK24]|uniref:beta-glucosidase n=1 Tax=Rhodanobacter sp. 7MK24 TaxID=2775922 RepID=UPI00177E6B3F|nr:glycoside hydrolase family 3 C-terminal domain-containing protein [Rhodanobacter sp. 7MK24]MBD8880208.1 glycoside hydrolase family 3 C-terminal domain-containing protein [Rhodanobacter sp. 7MK24]
MALHKTRIASFIGMALLAFGGTCAAATAGSDARPWMNPRLSPDQRAELVLKAMTQDEKFRLIRVDFGDTENGHVMAPGALGSAGYGPAIARLGLPGIQESDAGLGVAKPLKLGATALPSGLATAASFDPTVAYAGGAMIGSEAHRRGFNVMLAGGVDLVRDPRNGRNFEYAGEDPLLAGQIAGNAIAGIQSQHLVSTIKHYAFNDLETNRNAVSANIDKASARESDLLAFEIAIAAGHPGSVMCSYNRVNAVYACENDWLLNDVLKRDWHYPGFVMSDWGAVHSAAKSALAGLDQESAGETFDKEVYFDKPLRAAVTSGEVPQSRIDDMARRILRSLFATGAIDHPAKQAAIDFGADRKVAQRAEEAGAVLLRNQDALLPLSAAQSVAVIGAHADKGVLTGGGSSAVQSPQGNAVPGLAPTDWPGPRIYQPSAPLAAIQQRARGTVSYASGDDIAAAAKLAAQAKVAVVFVEQWAAESVDTPHLTLPGNQDALVEAVAKANPHTIVVLENNGPVAMPWLAKVGAVLEAWYPGAAGGEAIARLLYGEVDPSGRLPLTWPRDESQLPRPKIPGAVLTSMGQPPQGQPAQDVDYNVEGADVGYRWYQRKHLEPLFPFGYGLAYTHFDYSGFAPRVANGKVTASFTVTNRGTRAGVDVPQLYVTLPGPNEVRRLAGWCRVDLKPGQSAHLTVTADPRLLVDFDRKSQHWQQPAGDYQLQLGHSATSFQGDGKVALPAASWAADASPVGTAQPCVASGAP